MDKLQMIKEMTDIIHTLSDSFSLILTSIATIIIAINSKKPPKHAGKGGFNRKKK